MSAVTEKVAFPKTHKAEKDGWTLTINCKGVYTEFVSCTAQAGDPKGSITLEGHGMSVSVGTGWRMCPCCLLPNKQFPINLSKGQQLIRQLSEELRNKYNKEPNMQFLFALGREVFEPYDKYFN